MPREGLRLLVFGGPYSNLPATRAMKATAERLGIGPGHVICTGDVVAYCAEPEETTKLVREWGITVVQGNCEEQLAAGGADCGCGFEEGSACEQLSKSWYGYAQARISPASRAWMASLPRTLRLEIGGHSVLVLHGGTRQINRFVFASECDTLAEELAHADADLVIAGHAGIPFIHRAGRSTWLNAGVIGMPANDGTPDGWYALLTLGEGHGQRRVRISLHRLAYEHSAAAASTAGAGHATSYARALSTGLWPSLDVLPPAERARTGLPIEEIAIDLPPAPRSGGDARASV